MTALELITDLRAHGVELTPNGDRLAYDAPSGTMTPDVLALLKANKAALLAALAPKRVGCVWRVDKVCRLCSSDGTVYAPTTAGGYVLVKHPTRRMIAPGTVELTQ